MVIYASGNIVVGGRSFINMSNNFDLLLWLNVFIYIYNKMSRFRHSHRSLTSQNQEAVGSSKQSLTLIDEDITASDTCTTETSTTDFCPLKFPYRRTRVRLFRIIPRKEEKHSCEISPGTIFSTNAQLETLRGCTKIIGDLRISNAIEQLDFSVFDYLEEITGSLFIIDNAELTAISGFGALGSIGESLFIFDNAELTAISGFGALESIGSFFHIHTNAELTAITGFGALGSIGESLIITDNALLTAISGFGALESIGGSFEINNNTALTGITGFGMLGSIGGVFYIINNGSSATVGAFDVVTTVTGFGNLSTDPKGILDILYLQGESATKLLGIAEPIRTNLIDATVGNKIIIYVYPAYP